MADTTRRSCSSGGGFYVCVGWNYTHPHAYLLAWNYNKAATLSSFLTLTNHHWHVTRKGRFDGNGAKLWLEKWGIGRQNICSALYVPATALSPIVVVCHTF